ncbi:MAG TPA: hypothetical protein VHC22_14315 [Pirellulales bacterium]|nr:hypothetical protein [Pirellulales bacterium]
MRRRFLQFSLRWLLGMATLVCLALGGWHLLETYGYQLEQNGTRFKGRCIRVLGPAKRHLAVAGRAADGTVLWTVERDVERSWLCCYEWLQLAFRWREALECQGDALGVLAEKKAASGVGWKG